MYLQNMRPKAFSYSVMRLHRLMYTQMRQTSMNDGEITKADSNLALSDEYVAQITKNSKNSHVEKRL